MNALNEVLKRFEREAKALAKLSHPNIVKVYDYGEHEGSPYLVMEYLPGGTLKKILGKPVLWRDAVRLILPVVRGVAYAHQRGILHRDIKPANVLITDDGEPMLSDFGIAKLFEGEQTTALTGSGMAIGTPEYMAPEQWTGITSPQSDLYSLGIVLYELVTGRKPYVADTPAAILIKQATEPLPSPRKFTVDLPEGLELVLIKVLARESGDRYHDINAFIVALENLIIGEPVSSSLVNAPVDKAHLETISTQIPIQLVNDKEKTVSVFEAQKVEGLSKYPPSQARVVSPLWRLRKWMTSLIGGIVIALAVWLGSPSIARWFSLPPVVTEQAIATLTLTFPPITPLETIESSQKPTEILTSTSTIAVTPLPNEITDLRGVQMMLIFAGNFIMGNDNGSKDEKPAHTVYLDSFYIDKYEVTNKLYKACVDVGACDSPVYFRSSSRDNYYGNPLFENYPVISVTWNMAKNYCEWRDAQLPTEAQWEKSSQGSVAEEDYSRYSQGCLIVDVSGCVDDTYSVGSNMEGKSDYEVYNMLGNVWEWVGDWYDANYYSLSPTQNPFGPTEGSYKVFRGRGWIVDQGPVFITLGRSYTSPSSTYVYIGFRCAKSVP